MEPTIVSSNPTPAPAPKTSPISSGGSATEKMLIGLVAGLIVGGGAGWYLGTMMSLNQAAEEKRAALEQQQLLQGNTSDSQNNPLDDIQTNPYDGVKINPFE